ncbi:gliding motility-associated C-terminal domain-containing protein, partial [Flavihumibacter sp.]|uniref:T9SS type B sorting domain-containing protein n=1 Tax=Flavihumibacter sp. TaxID=1913981 RepID=UPI002FC6C81B
WTGPNGYSSTDEDITTLAAGTYTVTVTDANGCTATKDIEVTVDIQAITAIPTIGLTTCIGSTGTITLEVTGGTPAYSYSWTGPAGYNADTKDITGLVAGMYTVVITDLNGCTTTLDVEVGTQDVTIDLSEVINPAICTSNNGGIDLSIAGGTTPYTISWTGPSGFNSTDEDLTSLAPGVYTVTVTDANGCTATKDIEVTIDVQTITAVPTVGLTACTGATGTIALEVSGGTPAYSYSWTGPGSFTADTKDITGLVAGMYTVVITDLNGCTTTLDVEVGTQDVTIDLTEVITPAICTSNNGGIDLSIAGGTAPYTISWTGPNGFNSIDEDLTSLAPGVYTVTVTDANGCSANKNIEVTIDIQIITVVPTIGLTTCIGATGTIALEVTGGTPAYSYSWTGPAGFTADTKDINGLVAGMYSVVITDLNGCTTTLDVEVGTQDVTIDLTEVITQAICTSNNGAIDLSIAGGTAPYTISWTGPGGFTSSDQDLVNLAPGTYSVTVTDANGCSATKNIEVTIDKQVITAVPAVSATSCIGATGAISLVVSGGTPAYAYSWTGPANFTADTKDLTGLVAGIYTVVITDLNGCTTTLDVEVNSVDVAIILTENITQSICGNANGSISMQIQGGTAPYSISWSGPNGFMADTKDISGIGAGDYSVTVTDINGCSVTKNIIVANTDVSIIATPTVADANCRTTDGSITVQVNGGTAPYTYEWNGPAGFTSTQTAISALAPGDYTLVITDANGCSVNLDMTVGEIICCDITATASAPDILCDQTAVDITVEAKDGYLPYEYSIDGGATYQSSNVFTNRQAGNYTITVRDAKDCIATTDVNINQIQNTVAATITTPDIPCGFSTGTITVSASNGTAPYRYSLDGGNSFQTSNVFNDLPAGDYTILVIDANNCTTTASGTLVQLVSTIVLNVAAPDMPCGATTGSFRVNASNGTAPYKYSLDNGATYQDSDLFADMAPGDYTITVLDAGGCLATATVSFVAIPNPVVVTNDPAAVCAPATIDLTAAAITSGSDAGLVYSYWMDEDGVTPLAQPDAVTTGRYYIRGTAANGCAIIQPVNVTVNALPVLQVTNPLPVCQPAAVNILEAAVTAGSDQGLTLSYWRDDQTSQPIGNPGSLIQSGTYYIRAINAAGCVMVKPVVVTSLEAPELEITDPAPVCSPNTVDITTAAITAGSDTDIGLSYWRDEAATIALAGPAAIPQSGTYYIRAVNSNGCIDVKPVNVVVHALPEVSISGVDSLCLGLSTDLTIRFKGTGPWSFSYSDGSQTYTINNHGSDLYKLKVKPNATTKYTILTVSDRNCSITANGIEHTLWITYPIPGTTLPPIFTNGNTPTPLQARDLGPHYNMFNWSPTVGLDRYNIIDPVFNYDKRVQYRISMRSEAGCETIDTLVVNVINSTIPGVTPEVLVPTVWSPNGDGRNDLLFPFTINVRELRWFRVFNRWGELVYETKALGAGWNGYYKGAIQPLDTYTWVAEAIGINGEVIRKTGLVTLVR